MFFVVSTGRSGTTSIARILASIHGCRSRHEPAPELIIESSEYRYGTMDAETIRRILFYSRAPRVGGGRVYCESNQCMSLVIPVLAELYPQARYLWLIRDGRDVVASFYQKQEYTGHSDNHERYEDCPPVEKAWIDGRVRADRCGEMTEDEWESLDRFAKCCWYWGYVNRIIEQDLNAHAPDAHIKVRLEHLHEDMKHAVQWMGLKAALLPTYVRANPGKNRPYHWSNWSADERETFTRFCGDVMDRICPDWRAGQTWQDTAVPPDTAWLWRPVRWFFSRGRVVRKVNSLFAKNALHD